MNQCPRCESKHLKGVVYPKGHKYRIVGISEWHCQDCGYRCGAFCGRELKGTEVETYGCEGKNGHPRVFDIEDGDRHPPTYSEGKNDLYQF